MEKKRTVAIYARVSTEHEAQISALENQIQYYDDILERHPEWELYDKYIDEGVTGTSVKKRRSFIRMMEDAAAGRFDLIITREVSRFARNTVDTLQQTRILKRQGVEVYFTEDNIWTIKDEDGEFRLTIMATMAQNESKKISQRVKAGQKVSFENGVLYGNGNILGYDRIGKELVINEEQAATVRRIFDLYVEGNGATKICYQLEAENHLTATGLKRWHPSNITRILKNPFYCGVIVYRKQYVPDFLEQKKINNFGDVDQIVVEGTHTPIISKEQFEQAQKIIDANSVHLKTRESGERRRGVKRSPDVWCRKLKCQCGNTFNRVVWHTGKDKPKQWAYQCYGQVKGGSIKTRLKKGLSIEGCCDIKIVPRWKLEAMADVIFKKFWGDKKAIIKICNDMIDTCCEEQVENTRLADYQALQRKMEKWNNRYDNLLNMRMNGEIEKERYDEKREQLLKEQRKLQEEFAQYDEQEDLEEDLYEKKIQLLKAGIERDFKFDTAHLPDEIIDDFVDEIEVHQDYFVWRLNISPDDAIMKVSGRVNNYTVSQTDRSSLGIYSNGNKAMLANIYSEDEQQHIQLSHRIKNFAAHLLSIAKTHVLLLSNFCDHPVNRICKILLIDIYAGRHLLQYPFTNFFFYSVHRFHLPVDDPSFRLHFLPLETSPRKTKSCPKQPPFFLQCSIPAKHVFELPLKIHPPAALKFHLPDQEDERYIQKIAQLPQSPGQTRIVSAVPPSCFQSPED